MKSLQESLLDDDVLDKTDIAKAIKNIISSIPKKIYNKSVWSPRSKSKKLYYCNWNSEDFSMLVPDLKRICFYFNNDADRIDIQFFNNINDDLTDADMFYKNKNGMFGISFLMHEFISPYNKSSVKDKTLMINNTINLFKSNLNKLFDLYKYIKKDLERNGNKNYNIYGDYYKLEKLIKSL